MSAASAPRAARLILHRPPPTGRVYSPVKAVVEWVGALVLLVAAAPLMAGVAAALVCTSRGPVIYTQVRLGRRGRLFRIYKFRTMAHGCEAATGPVWSVAGDPRTTLFGKWLRATHVDELPQLWNVLRGEMTLIGPRPERPEIAEQIERVMPAFRDRLAVRPGLSGLAQVLLPPDADIDTVRHKLAHDLTYIRRRGAWLDLLLAVSTVLRLSGFGARVSGWLVRGYETKPVEVSGSPMLRLTVADFPKAGAAGGDQLSKAA